MADVLDDIAREVRENKVLVYMKGTPAFPMCGFSAATVQLLKEIGVPFKAVDVLRQSVRAKLEVAHPGYDAVSGDGR